jgi:apolipoprotein D and lipocalin family protein
MKYHSPAMAKAASVSHPLSISAMRSLGLLMLAAGFVGCQSTKPLPTAGPVDLKRYAGKWYEVARIKNRFQRNDESAIAEYGLIDDTRLHVRNTATSRAGKTRSIDGIAEVVPGSDGSKLRVKFGGLAALAPVPASGNYWIIDLDPRYRSALVGTPNRKYLWILARVPLPDAGTLNTYMTEADRLGFPTDKMIWDQDLGLGRPTPVRPNRTR